MSSPSFYTGNARAGSDNAAAGEQIGWRSREHSIFAVPAASHDRARQHSGPSGSRCRSRAPSCDDPSTRRAIADRGMRSVHVRVEWRSPHQSQAVRRGHGADRQDIDPVAAGPSTRSPRPRSRRAGRHARPCSPAHFDAARCRAQRAVLVVARRNQRHCHLRASPAVSGDISTGAPPRTIGCPAHGRPSVGSRSAARFASVHWKRLQRLPRHTVPASSEWTLYRLSQQRATPRGRALPRRGAVPGTSMRCLPPRAR